MPAIWIHIDNDGIVQGASVAAYTEPRMLQEWKERGGKVELIEADTVTLGQSLPPETRIIR